MMLYSVAVKHPNHTDLKSISNLMHQIIERILEWVTLFKVLFASIFKSDFFKDRQNIKFSSMQRIE